MSKRKTPRLVTEIVGELYESININLQHILNINRQLGDKTLPHEKIMQLTNKMLTIWEDLKPVHDTIRAHNPQGDMFFNSLDHELELFNKSIYHAKQESVKELIEEGNNLENGPTIEVSEE